LADCHLTTARKGKTMTKHMTGDSEVERDIRENENSAPGRHDQYTISIEAPMGR